MQILLTGANGFLGSNLVNFLSSKGHRVGALARGNSGAGQASGVDSFCLAPDCSNLDAIIAKFQPDTIIHTASKSYGDESEKSISEMIVSNIHFGSLLLASMKRNNVKRLLNCGTSWQESDGRAYAPFNFYAATKEAFEKIVDYYGAQGVSTTTFRLFDSYGPADPRKKILNLMIDAAVKGERLDMSPGHQKLVLVHVQDLCEAFELVLNSEIPATERNSVYALWHDEGASLRQVAEIIERVSDLKCSINWGGREYRVGEIMNPTSPFAVLPGWKPKISLENGIREVIESKLRARAALA